MLVGQTRTAEVPAGRDVVDARPPAPADRVPMMRYVLLGVVVFGLYVGVTSLNGPRRRADADRHSRQIYRLEQHLHLDVEGPLNRWLARLPPLRDLANYEYAWGYLLAAFAVLVWLFARRRGYLPWAVNSFLLVNLLGIITFALYPVTPPRLLPALGFADTVRTGHTFGSWGSALVSGANEVAAMPSLHVAWALWVGAVLASAAHTRRTRIFGVAHVALTVFVVLATANHYVLDAVGGAIVVAVSMPATSALLALARRRGERTARTAGERVAAADAFFLYVETPQAPQHVGGLVPLDWTDRGEPPSAVDVAAVIRDRLGDLPRFTQQLAFPGRRRRPRWVPAGELDWSWHVTEHDLRGPAGEPGGQAALDRFVAGVQATLLPRDRPLWRMFVVHGVADRQAAAGLGV